MFDLGYHNILKFPTVWCVLGRRFGHVWRPRLPREIGVVELGKNYLTLSYGFRRCGAPRGVILVFV